MAQSGMLSHLEGLEIGGCRLLRRLGAGGMGEVYLAEQVRLGGRLVAIKVIRPGDDAPDEFQDAARRFLYEGKLLGRFSHPNILPVHESGIDGDYLYLVMEYAPDGSLNDAIRGRGPHPLALPLATPLVTDIIRQIAAALQYTHGRGIVHGDVKPGNVLMETESDGCRRLLLADFGVARELEATAQWSIVAGTVAYMAPEQFSGRFSPASDQYALGIVAYQLLAGRTPFEGGFAEQMRGHLDGMPPRLRGLNPNVPSQAETAISHALAKDPRRRFPTVLAFADALEMAVRQEGETTVLGASGAWDATSRARPSTGASLPATRELQEHPGIHTYRPPSAAWGFLVAREPAATGSIGTSSHLGQRRLALVSICAALLLLAVVTTRGGTHLGTSNALAPHKVEAAATVPAHTPTTPTTPTVVATPVPGLPPLHVGPAGSGNSFAAVVSAPEAIVPGRRFTTDVTLRNTGDTTWSQSRGYRLTCDTVRIYRPPSSCTRDLAVSLGRYVIPPGNAITFQLLLTAPTTPGIYSAWVTMAQGRTLFSTAAAHIQVVVRKPTPRPAPTAAPRPLPTSTPRPEPTTTPADTATPAPTETPTPSLDTPTPTYTEESGSGDEGSGDRGSGDRGSEPSVELSMS